MQLRLYILLLVFPALLVSAVNAQELSEKEIVAGKKLYAGKCARCHKFYDPAAYDDEHWKTWMEKMRKKAKLNDEQYDALSRYLDTFRANEDRPKATAAN